MRRLEYCDFHTAVVAKHLLEDSRTGMVNNYVSLVTRDTFCSWETKLSVSILRHVSYNLKTHLPLPLAPRVPS